MICTFAHLAVCILSDNNRSVDQHAQAKQHAEHHHRVEGVPEQINNDHREQKGHGDTQSDNHTASKAHCRHHNYHHQRQRGHDVALKFSDLNLGKFRCNQRRLHSNTGWELLAHLLDDFQHRIRCCDHIRIGPLLDLDVHCPPTVKPRIARAIFEASPYFSNIGQGHYGVTVYLHRQTHYVGSGLDH